MFDKKKFRGNQICYKLKYERTRLFSIQTKLTKNKISELYKDKVISQAIKYQISNTSEKSSI